MDGADGAVNDSLTDDVTLGCFDMLEFSFSLSNNRSLLLLLSRRRCCAASATDVDVAVSPPGLAEKRAELLLSRLISVA